MTADPSAALAAIRARVEAATPGPWGYPFPRKNRITTAAYIDVTEADWGGEGLREYSLGCTEDRNAWRAEDAEFIAHARDDVPFLLAEVQRRDDALAAVLALHPDLPIRLGPDAGKAMCGTCGVYAPCPTVAAITDALGGAG